MSTKQNLGGQVVFNKVETVDLNKTNQVQNNIIKTTQLNNSQKLDTQQMPNQNILNNSDIMNNSEIIQNENIEIAQQTSKYLTQMVSQLKTELKQLKIQAFSEIDFKSEMAIQEKYLLDKLQNKQRKQNGQNANFMIRGNEMIKEDEQMRQLIEDCNKRILKLDPKIGQYKI